MNFRPEARLLLACAATGEGAPDHHAIAELARADLDWGWLVEAAHRHAVLPLVHRRLAEAGVERPELRARATRVALRNLRLSAELTALAREFEGREIPVLAWKGPALAMLTWGDLSLRQFGDLDLVVFPEDYERASEALVARGYRPDTVQSGRRFRSLLRRDWHWSFTHPEARTHIELHWRFSPGPPDLRLGVKEVWTRRQAMGVAGGTVASPCSEDLLLLLTDHGARHAWERLAWIVDVARLGSWPGLDWVTILTRARTIGAERMLLLGLSIAHHLLGAEVPPAAAERCARHPTLPAMAERVVRRLFERVPGQVGMGERWTFWLAARERPRDRVRLASEVLFGVGELDWNAVRMPEPIQPLYYIFRPFRLAWRQGARFLAGEDRC